MTGQVTLDIIEDSIFGNAVYRPTLVVANKADTEDSVETIENLRKAAEPLDVLVTSAERSPDLAETLGARLFENLNIIRVYTKQPGKPPSDDPIVAKAGITIGELAKIIHSDFYKRFRFARLWGPSANFDNERVGLSRGLTDGDVVQFHA